MRSLLWLVSIAAACGAIGCSNSLESPDPVSLIGVWQSTRVEYVSKQGLGTVELAGMGWVATLTLREDRTGLLEMVPADRPGWNWPGSWEVDGDLFRIAGQGGRHRAPGPDSPPDRIRRRLRFQRRSDDRPRQAEPCDGKGGVRPQDPRARPIL